MTEMKRADGRRWDEPRPVNIEVGYQRSAEGSALIEMGATRVLCAASLEERVPQFLRGQGRGWVTAEYSMLPRATSTRASRERDSGRVSGRSQEIQRLIGRSLRAVTDMEALGERTVQIDWRRYRGRRRHSDGVHHRGLRRAAPGDAAAGAPAGAAPRAAGVPGGGGERGHPAGAVASSTSAMPRTSRPTWTSTW